MDPFPDVTRGKKNPFTDTKTAQRVMDFLNALRTAESGGNIKITISDKSMKWDDSSADNPDDGGEGSPDGGPGDQSLQIICTVRDPASGDIDAQLLTIAVSDSAPYDG